jgi:hypothetical protein
MKFLPGLFILLFTSAACHKSNVNAPYGSWRYIKLVQSGATPVTFPSPPDTTVVLNLGHDNSYSVTINGNAWSSGSFRAEPATSESRYPRLSFSKPQNYGYGIYDDMIFALRGDTLTLTVNEDSGGLIPVFYYKAIP